MTEPHDAPRTDPEATSEESTLNAGQTPPSPGRKTPKRVIFFGTCAVVAILAFCIANADAFVAFFGRIGEVLTPLLIGGVIAYLCNPFLKFYEYTVFRRMKKSNLRRGLSLLCTVLTAFGLLAAVIALIVPELIDSIKHLVDHSHEYLERLLVLAYDFIDSLSLDIDKESIKAYITQEFGTMEVAMQKLGTFLQSYVLNTQFLGNVWAFLLSIFNALKNVLLGMFIAFYILSSKEKRIAQIRKFRAAYFNEKQDRRIKEVTKLVDRTFGGFIKGVLLDALAVGVVTFILLSIFRVSEYNLLIAAICAVTNIIPVFGPFIGAIPSGLIVLISNPSKLLVFVILVVVIQQIDGNILCPRIQGNNTGVSSLAVLIAITVMGSLFGLVGMVIGVPIFAVIIELIKRAIEVRLTRRGVPTDTTYYYPANAVGNAEEDVYYEHSHLRYRYDHSKFKVYVDRVLIALKLDKKKRKQSARATKAAKVVKAKKAKQKAKAKKK